MSDSTLVRHGQLSEFAQRQFEAAGLGDVAVRVSQGELLARQDTERFAEVSLPLLAKLVSLRRKGESCVTPAVDPVFYLPHSDMAKMVDTIRIAVGELAALIDQDARVRGFGDCMHTLHVLVDSADEAACRTLEGVAERLFQDEDVFEESVSPSRRAGASDARASGEDQSPLSGPNGPTLPKGRVNFKTRSDEGSSIRVSFAGRASIAEPAPQAEAAETMREIASVYLQSPAGTEIRALIGQLGIKTADVALSFGANHFGQAALDRQTAEVLRIPTLTKLADALRYDTPTPV